MVSTRRVDFTFYCIYFISLILIFSLEIHLFSYSLKAYVLLTLRKGVPEATQLFLNLIHF